MNKGRGVENTETMEESENPVTLSALRQTGDKDDVSEHVKRSEVSKDRET